MLCHWVNVHVLNQIISSKMFMNGIAIDVNLTKNPLDDQHRSESKKQLSRRAVRVPLFLGCLLHHWQSLVKALYTRTMVVLKSKPWPTEKNSRFSKSFVLFWFLRCWHFFQFATNFVKWANFFQKQPFLPYFQGEKRLSWNALQNVLVSAFVYILQRFLSKQLVCRRNVTKTATFHSENMILAEISSVITSVIYQDSAI